MTPTTIENFERKLEGISASKSFQSHTCGRLVGCRTVVLATHTPLARVLPAPQAAATSVIMPSAHRQLQNPAGYVGRITRAGNFHEFEAHHC